MINSFQSHYILGTWQLSGDFGPRPITVSQKLLEDAWELGIRQFDTAGAYGSGTVERLLGETLPSEAFIITKVPGALYPNDPLVSFEDCYSTEYFLQYVENSAIRLKRPPNVVLFHNWSPFWKDEAVAKTVAHLRTELAAHYKAKIGISLPNQFARELEDSVCREIEYVEAPANPSEPWLTRNYVERLKALKVNVILRSLFKQGLAIKNPSELLALSEEDKRFKQREAYLSLPPQTPRNIIENTLKAFQCPLVIGATSRAQLAENIAQIAAYMAPV